MANKMNSTKVVTGVVRLSYANVWEPGVYGWTEIAAEV